MERFFSTLSSKDLIETLLKCERFELKQNHRDVATLVSKCLRRVTKTIVQSQHSQPLGFAKFLQAFLNLFTRIFFALSPQRDENDQHHPLLVRGWSFENTITLSMLYPSNLHVYHACIAHKKILSTLKYKLKCKQVQAITFLDNVASCLLYTSTLSENKFRIRKNKTSKLTIEQARVVASQCDRICESFFGAEKAKTFVLQIMNVMLPMGRTELEEWNDDPETFYRNQSLNKDKEEHARFSSENFLLTLLERDADSESDILPHAILTLRDKIERTPISNLRDVRGVTTLEF